MFLNRPVKPRVVGESALGDLSNWGPRAASAVPLQAALRGRALFVSFICCFFFTLSLFIIQWCALIIDAFSESGAMVLPGFLPDLSVPRSIPSEPAWRHQRLEEERRLRGRIQLARGSSLAD